MAWKLYTLKSTGSYVFPDGSEGKEPTWNAGGQRRCRFDPRVRERPLEKKMATHSIMLAWRNPWTEEPGGLQSMLLQRVRHDWAHTQQACHHYSYFWYVIK